MLILSIGSLLLLVITLALVFSGQTANNEQASNVGMFSAVGFAVFAGVLSATVFYQQAQAFMGQHV